MRKLLSFALMLTLVGSAMAIDLGNEGPAKPAANAPQNVPNDIVLQGGDTILDAVMVTLPANTTGTTAGYYNDYDEVCPYTGSMSPDVVYTFVASDDMIVEVDLFGSTYDTKVYVYDQDLALIACNDDFYPDYVSKIEDMPVIGGVQYFVVVDGYGGDFGDYVMAIYEFVPPPPCVIDCPYGAAQENEPPLAIDYEDAWNGGCNSPEFGNPFQPFYSSVFCGVSGFYLNGGSNFRDTDWFNVPIQASGMAQITGDAEELMWMFELGPQDCGSVGVVQQVGIGPCLEGSITIVGTPGSTVWFWMGPQEFSSPDGSDVFEFDYVLRQNLPVATEDHSWTDVKALFD